MFSTRNILIYTVFKNRVAATLAKAKGVVDNKYTALVERGMTKLNEMVEMMATNLMT